VLSCWVDDDALYFSVKDSGIGMSPEVLDRLFQPFEQADQSISRRFGGTGLGLHISWILAEHMDGTIEVSSEEGKGSLFVLKLPYRESELPVQNLNTAENSESVLTERFVGEVLIVEDTPELQQLERRIVQTMGATVTLASNGEEAIEQVHQHNFDLILMDMQMPIMDGLEATTRLRGEGDQTPIVALTANVMQRHREQFGEVGADGFLQKPINKVELRQILRRYLRLDNQRLPETERAPRNPICSEGARLPDGSSSVTYRPPYPLLIIDDEHSVLDLYQTVLGEEEPSQGESVMGDIEALVGLQKAESSVEKYSLSLANQGQVGVEMARLALQQECPFPVAFIDMRMPPGINGLDTAKALRKLDERIYIVIVSAYSDVGLQEINRELKQGVLYLQKPFSRDEVQQAAKMLVQNWLKDHQTAPPVLQSSEAEQPSISAQAEEEVDEELMAIFIDSTTKNRKNLTLALSNKDWDGVRATAHTIKGSGASFGYPELSKLAETLQLAIDNGPVEQVPALTHDLVTELGRVLP
jgi:CheY-like chemotaxis protein/HPt (histidine-containing phosphotransfer) domain-containing protein